MSFDPSITSVKLIMRGLCTDLLTAEQIPRKPAKRPSDERCDTGHRLKWGPLRPNEVVRIAQDVRKREGSQGGKDSVYDGVMCCGQNSVC